jgi:hypothetical protein
MITDSIGVHGNDYLQRAVIAQILLTANQPEDAIYPLIMTDADGRPPVGEDRYVLHFDKGKLPPVHAFWSLSMYDAQGFQVANPINRFAIGDRDPLKYNADGSLDLYVQHDNPGGDKTANWLPSPSAGVLGLTMRLYAPVAQVRDGSWRPQLCSGSPDRDLLPLQPAGQDLTTASMTGSCFMPGIGTYTSIGAEAACASAWR